MPNLYPPIYRVTTGPNHHFFGYYDKSPWSKDNRYMIVLETSFINRPPNSNDRAIIGIIDLENENFFKPIAETRAWNWQQGCMLQWMPNEPDRLIIYNDRIDGQFVSIILDVFTGEKRILPRPIYSVSHNGKFAVTLNFSRLYNFRPGYGYAGIVDPWKKESYPEDDGIYFLDLESGESHLIISIAQIFNTDNKENMNHKNAQHRFEHLLINQNDSRFIFLHRWCSPNRKLLRRLRRINERFTRMFTANLDGSDIYCVSNNQLVSHFDWKNHNQILAWAHQPETGDRYFLFIDQTPQVEIIGDGILTCDGHCSYSPDGRWILTDTYPDKKNIRTLILYRLSDGCRFDIGNFLSPPEIAGEFRCDLHPRWNRDGTKVCIDSIHEGYRQMYVIDASEIIHS